MKRLCLIALLAFVAVAASVSGTTTAEAAPVTEMRLDSEPGDPFGNGVPVYVSAADGAFSARHENDRVTFNVETPSGAEWSFGFGAPEGVAIGVGPYDGAEPEYQGNPVKPWLSVHTPDGHCAEGAYGSFTVGEVESAFGDASKLSVDFEIHCGPDGGPLFSGELRLNAEQAMPPAPDGDGDGIPDTQDSCPGVASPITSDADGDRIADPCDPDFTITFLQSTPHNHPQLFVRPADALLSVFNTVTLDQLHVNYDTGPVWHEVTLEPPQGQQLGVGTFPVNERYPTSSSAAIGVYEIDGCSGGDRYGQFEIFEFEVVAEQVVRLSADLEYSCTKGQPVNHYVSVRIDADNSPVSVAGSVRVDGAAKQGVTIEAVDVTYGTTLSSSVSGSGGAFDLDIYPVPVQLKAVAPGMVTQWLGPFVHRELTDAVAPGRDGLRGLAFDLHSGGVLAGRTLPSGSGKVYEAGVHLYNEAGEQLTEPYEIPVYEERGVSYYEVFGYEPGAYRVLLVPFGETYAATWYPDSPSFFGAESVSISDGELTVANVRLPLAGRISVRVLTPDGEEVEYPHGEVYNLADISGLAGSTSREQMEWNVAEGYWYVLGANYDSSYDLVWDYFPEWYSDAPHHRPDRATPLYVAPGEQVSIEMVLDPLFIDMFGSVFVDDIYWLRGMGITYGCSADRFCTYDFVTRGEMAAFLSRALSLPPASGKDFIDDDLSIFESDIERLAGAGITLGCNPPVNDRFCPDKYVTRGQMAAFLTRALSLGESDVTEFVDDDGSVFEDDIERLAGAGITQGCNPPENDRFCPDDYVTRGQMAAFMHRALTSQVAQEAEGLDAVIAGP